MNKRRGYVIIPSPFIKPVIPAKAGIHFIFPGFTLNTLKGTIGVPWPAFKGMAGRIGMLIIIDGYNLIRQSDNLRRYEQKSLEAGRQALIARLKEYEKRKKHQIAVIFDGGQSDWIDEGRDREGKILILYSRFGEKADDVIKRLAAKTAGEVIVVSSDRDIASYIRHLGKTPLSSPEFEKILDKTILSPPPAAAIQKNGFPEQKIKKKGPAKRLPRALRKAQTKINKL